MTSLPNAERAIREFLDINRLTPDETGVLEVVLLAAGKNKIKIRIRDRVALTVSMMLKPCGRPDVKYDVDFSSGEDITDPERLRLLQRQIGVLLDDIRQLLGRQFGRA